MCGICGIYHYEQGAPVQEALLRPMLSILRHRGPDDEGLYLDGALAMGMRRLSIIDLAGGKQPIDNEDGRVVVVFNGEIYNYRDLRSTLQARGHAFKTASDTEVLVHLYEEYGADCVQHLRGMFAFALWDQARRRLLLARDHLGVKPLYYTQVGGTLLFASEIKAILQYPAVQPQMDMGALSHYLSLRYVPAPQTMFTGIFALPPGHLLLCDATGVQPQRYWDLSFAGQQRSQQNGQPNGRSLAGQSEAAYAEQLQALLQESVRLQLMSDVPFGAFLSGGLDSSTIVALMSQYLNEPVKTFSVGFQGDGAAVSELPYARQVAEQYQADHHEIQIGPQDFVDFSETVAWHLDQPVADVVVLANYMVAKLAAQHVKMVLTGEGGDELFAGYARYAGERFSPLFQPLPQPAKALALALSNHLPGLRRPKIALYALCQSTEATRFANWFPLFNDTMKAAVMTDALQEGLVHGSTAHLVAHHLAQTDAAEPLHRMLYVDTKLWLPDNLLARGDKLSMAVSLEARVPLLDHKLVEFAATLPPHLKLRNLTRKYLLKQVSQRWLPPTIIQRKKQGFPVPIAEWLRGGARPFVRDLLSPTLLQRRGLFEPHYVERLLNEHEAGQADHSVPLFGLLSVELWLRQYMDVQPRA